MDVHELVSESTICAGVLGRGEEYILIRLDEDFDAKQEAVRDAVAHGLFYCGTLGCGGAQWQSVPFPHGLPPPKFKRLPRVERPGATVPSHPRSGFPRALCGKQ